MRGSAGVETGPTWTRQRTRFVVVDEWRESHRR
jgi:hypothetical protein